jgi:hypothetical protein
MRAIDDGPPIMPASTYPKVWVYQRLPLDWEGAKGMVVMRGALYCRVAKRGTARCYATAMLERYIRRLRITETDPVRWNHWMHRELLRVARQRSWWSARWEKAVISDLQWLVGDYSVLIEGVRHDIYGRMRLENVRNLGRVARKYTGELPRLGAPKKPIRSTAIKSRQN